MMMRGVTDSTTITCTVTVAVEMVVTLLARPTILTWVRTASVGEGTAREGVDRRVRHVADM